MNLHTAEGKRREAELDSWIALRRLMDSVEACVPYRIDTFGHLRNNRGKWTTLPRSMNDGQRSKLLEDIVLAARFLTDKPCHGIRVGTGLWKSHPSCPRLLLLRNHNQSKISRCSPRTLCQRTSSEQAQILERSPLGPESKKLRTSFLEARSTYMHEVFLNMHRRQHTVDITKDGQGIKDINDESYFQHAATNF